MSMYGPIVERRKEATMFGLVSAMYEAALALPGGLSQAYEENLHYTLASDIYQTYLGIMARSIYFNETQPSNNAFQVDSVTTQNLLFLSTISTILFCVTLGVLSLLVLGALMGHWQTFHVQLRADPNTMAGQGMLLSGGSDVARLLEDPDMTQREMKDMLRQHRWGLHQGKVCVEDELEWDGEGDMASQKTVGERVSGQPWKEMPSDEQVAFVERQ
ncbi:hypothetical protein BV25DRAFT_938246 [Artomyces pyxidatus]|uniref:Uncharacterized protein n=1 Tax=Artomyces pyxidatus TaxID=48021 RepID=A0ACB8SWC8_9AGAM|nr:hypothetical protein BV25DRAFT_938246 [Artomyces pyxidatus]